MILKLEQIRRHELRAHPDWLFVYGDNVERVGLAGQAKEMRGEPNAVGIATKWSPWDYFSDDRVLEQKRIIRKDMGPLFHAAWNGRTIVLPAAGLGTGLAELPKRSPRTYRYLCDEIERLTEIAK